ncbi:response regulator transcription factor [Desulfosporosinus nitroreducens]|uniref:Stage 0 sporulation protein A homolog n=1 Tax=Desulfosporosinus nitroreducens TaxID=2018668 RepID=A0ABT8QYA8_9FIRM|nr:response regulator transcription factor [Desulfosporosinus nitroreducens]MDO0825539.1 response regulator transcription factor [Desulfosporosinus nitroreducens]
MKLLVIEDEISLQSALQKGFIKLGYAVDTASDGEEALEHYYSSPYDAIILDMNLPKIGGIDVLKEIRKENSEIKVLILSARSELEDKIAGLDMGANDYLAKPFHFKELEARVRALLRRNFSTQNTEISTDRLVLNTALKKMYLDGVEITLTKKEYGIVEYLLMHKGTLVSGEDLIEHVWDSEADSFTNAFKVHINALRKKLPQSTIKNIRGQGYYVE